MASKEYHYFEKKTGFIPFFLITGLIFIAMKLIEMGETFFLHQVLNMSYRPMVTIAGLFESPILLIGAALSTAIMTEVSRLRFNQGSLKASGLVTAFFLLLFIITFIILTTIIINTPAIDTFFSNFYRLEQPGSRFLLLSIIRTFLKLGALYLLLILIAQGEPLKAFIFSIIYSLVYFGTMVFMIQSGQTGLSPFLAQLPGIIINTLWLCALLVYYLFFNRIIQLDITEIKKISPFMEDISKNSIPILTGALTIVALTFVEEFLLGGGYINYNSALKEIITLFSFLFPLSLALRWTIQTFCAGNSFDVYKIIKKSILPVGLVISLYIITIFPLKDIILRLFTDFEGAYYQESVYYFPILGVSALLSSLFLFFGALYRGIKKFKKALAFEIFAPVLSILIIFSRFSFGSDAWMIINIPGAALCLYGLLSLTFLKKSLVLENIQDKKPFIYKKDRQRNVSFTTLVKEKLLFNFSGPASRREFLITQALVLLYGLLVYLVPQIYPSLLEDLKNSSMIMMGLGTALFILFTISIACISLSVIVRRLHDIGLSGVVVLVFAVFIPIPFLNLGAAAGCLLFLSIKGPKKPVVQIVD